MSEEILSLNPLFQCLLPTLRRKDLGKLHESKNIESNPDETQYIKRECLCGDDILNVFHLDVINKCKCYLL